MFEVLLILINYSFIWLTIVPHPVVLQERCHYPIFAVRYSFCVIYFFYLIIIFLQHNIWHPTLGTNYSGLMSFNDLIFD